MAEEEDLSAADEADGGEGGGARKKFSKRSLLLFIVLPLVLLIGLGAGAWVSGLADPLLAMFLGAPPEGEHGEAHKKKVVDAGPTSYYDLPQMLVNLNNTGRKSNFLKIVVSLEVSGERASQSLDEALPRIVDNFQVYLRELRVEDLRGSAGVYRLREELLFRVNAAVADVKVTDVLFKEMLVQ
jgi:flagellar FliL protein